MACAPKPVSKKDVNASALAKKAIDDEWARLKDKTVWDPRRVREWTDVAAETQHS